MDVPKATLMADAYLQYLGRHDQGHNMVVAARLARVPLFQVSGCMHQPPLRCAQPMALRMQPTQKAKNFSVFWQKWIGHHVGTWEMVDERVVILILLAKKKSRR